MSRVCVGNAQMTTCTHTVIKKHVIKRVRASLSSWTSSRVQKRASPEIFLKVSLERDTELFSLSLRLVRIMLLLRRLIILRVSQRGDGGEVIHPFLQRVRALRQPRRRVRRAHGIQVLTFV